MKAMRVSRWVIDTASGLHVVEDRDVRFPRWFFKNGRSANDFENIPHRLRSVLGLFRHHFADDVVEFGGDVVVDDQHGRCRRGEVFAQQVVWGIARERGFADEHFVEHAAEGIDVAAWVETLPANLLGRHVGAGPFDFAFATEEFAKPCFGFLGDGEVDEFYQAIAIDENIIGLDIAMDITLAMEVVEGFADLLDDRGKHVSDRFGTLSQRLLQVHFAEEFEDDEGGVGVGDVLDQLDDVLVMEIAGDLELMFEETDFLFVAALFWTEHFEGIAIAVVFDSFPDLTSTSEADQAGQSVWSQEVSNFNHENPVFCPGMAPPPLPYPGLGKEKPLLWNAPGALPCPASRGSAEIPRGPYYKQKPPRRKGLTHPEKSPMPSF